MTTEPTAEQPELDRSSSALKNAFELTPNGLTVLLMIMCFVPVVTIFVLWRILPPVLEGKLQAAVSAEGIPSDEYYETEARDEFRPPVPPGRLLVQNLTDEDWEMPNIILNTYYQIYDTEPIKAREVRAFDLDHFITRTGARFQVRYNTLKTVRIFAKLPSRERASFNYSFTESGFPDPFPVPWTKSENQIQPAMTTQASSAIGTGSLVSE